MERSKDKKNKKSRKNKNQNVQKGNVPRSLVMNKMITFVQMIHTQLALLVGNDTPDMMLLRFKGLHSTNPQKYASTKSLFKNMSRDVFGTWMPSIKFYGTTFAVAGVTGVLSTVARLRPSELDYFASLAGIFDEFKFKGPIKVIYRPTYEITSASLGWSWAVGVVDFVDSAALSSIPGAMFFDTAKVFLLPMDRKGDGVVEWKTHLLGQPDEIWRDTGDTTTDVAWWKCYNFLNIAGSLTYGYVNWEVMLEFRQLYGI